MSLAESSDLAPAPRARPSPRISWVHPPGGFLRPQHPQRRPAHSHARRLPFLGQDGGAPAHLVGGAHRRRAARLSRDGRRAVPRLPHRLLPDPAADGRCQLCLVAAVRPAAPARGSTMSASGASCSASRASASIAPAATGSRARAGAASAPGCRGARGPSPGPICGPCCSYLSRSAGSCRGAPCGCRRRCSTIRASATRHSPSAAARGLSTGASGWCGSAAIVSSSGTLAAIFAVIGFDIRAACPDPRLRGATGAMSAASSSWPSSSSPSSAPGTATRVLNYFASQTQFQGTAFTLARQGRQLHLADRQQLPHPHTVARGSSRRSPRRARRAISSTGSPSTARSPGNEIGQNPDALLKSGEGLAEAFNVDAF